MRQRLHFLLLNIGHFLDHLLMLVFATVAALALTREWGLGYGDLARLATPGFVAFGLCALPAGWLADRWSREGMMAVFFVGAGLATMATAAARTPTEIAAGLLFVGVFAAIYHPVGLALVYEMAPKAGLSIAINGVWGNLGVGSAALVTGFLIDAAGWRAAFLATGALSVAMGLVYLAVMWPAVSRSARRSSAGKPEPRATARGGAHPAHGARRILAVVLVAAVISGVVFQATTFALPKVLEEAMRSADLSASAIGQLTFAVFAAASLAQLVVGRLIDTLGPRRVLMTVTLIQAVFFLAMAGATGWVAAALALGFMIGAFGQIPVNDYVIGRLASGERRASAYGARFLVSFLALAAALPLIAWIHERWGFDTLFLVLSAGAAAAFALAMLLPRRLPEAG